MSEGAPSTGWPGWGLCASAAQLVEVGDIERLRHTAERRPYGNARCASREAGLSRFAVQPR